MSVRDTRQIAIYLDKAGRVVDKQTLSADRREVTYLPREAVRVVTTPQGFKSGKTNVNPAAQAGYDVATQRRKEQRGRRKSFGARSVQSATKYRQIPESDYNYFGAFYKLRMYSDGCGEFLVGEEVEQSYFKPISSIPKGRLTLDKARFTDLEEGDIGPRHTITDSAVAPHISSLHFGGTGSNLQGHTGGILYIDHHPSFGFTTGFTSAANETINNTFMHTDFFIKPLSQFKHDAPIFGKAKQTGAGGTAAMEFALVARNNGLAWKYTKTNAGATTAVSNTVAITTNAAKSVVGLTGALSLGGTAPWFHIQVERAYNQFRFYIDGTLEAVHAIGTGDGVIGSDGDFIIGGHRDGKDSLNCLIDQFHFRLGSPGATVGDRSVIGRGYLGGGFTSNATYANTALSTGATVAVPTTGVESFKDRHTKLLLPMDGIHLCSRVVERGNNLITGRVVGWDTDKHHLFIDNVGFTGDLVSGTGDQGSEYFSRDYGWVYGERGNQANVQTLRSFEPSTSQVEPTFSATSSAGPSPHQTIHPTSFSPSISPTPTTTVGFTGGHPGVTSGVSPSPSPSGHFGGPHPTPHVELHPTDPVKHPGDSPLPSFTPQPSSSASPSVSPSTSVSPTTTLTAHELVHPSTSFVASPTKHIAVTPSPTFASSVHGPLNSPSVSPSPTTTLTSGVSPHASPIPHLFSPSPSPSGTTGPFGSPHLGTHSHPHPNITSHSGTLSPTPTLTSPSPTFHVGPPTSASPAHTTAPTSGVHGDPVHPVATPTPTIHFTKAPTITPTIASTVSPSPHFAVSPTPHWFHPSLHQSTTVRPSDFPTTMHPTVGIHQVNSPSPHFEAHNPDYSPSPSITPSQSPPPQDETGSLATWEMEDYDLLMSLDEAKELAVEEAINEATRNLDKIISGTQGHAGDLKYLFEDSTGSSGSAALAGVASVSEPDGNGTRTFGGVTNPETGTTETYHSFQIKPTNELINRLNAIVTAGAYGKQDAFYIVPNAFGEEHYLTYHDCRLLFLDLVNYRYKVQNAFTSAVSSIKKSTQIAEVRTTSTKTIPANKSGAFVTGRITSYSDVVTTSASALKKTGVSASELKSISSLSSQTFSFGSQLGGG